MFDLKDWPAYIAIPLTPGVDWNDVSSRPELFRIINVDLDTVQRIGQSPFSLDAMDKTGEYPIELGEDPIFDAGQVDILLMSLETWRNKLEPADKNAFELVESTLHEAKRRGVGIYFKF